MSNQDVQFLQGLVFQLHQCLFKFLDLPDADKMWDPIVLTEALVVTMFTHN